MTSRKKIWFQAVGISAALTFVGVSYNAVNLTASAPHITEVVAEDVHVRSRDAGPRPPEDVRVREYTPEWREEAERSAAPPGGDGVMGEMDSLAYMEPPTLSATGSDLTRGEAMVRVEDIQAELQEDLFPEHREALEREKFNLLAEHFPAAAGEEPDEPPPEYGEPKNGDEHFLADLDINNIFNKMWGLLQALVVGWLPYKLNKKKKEELLTNSVIDRIDEELIERHRRKYNTKKHKV